MHFDVADFIIKIKNGHWGTNYEHIKLIYALIANNTLQVKFLGIDPEQKDYVTNELIKAKGSIKKTMPVIIMEGRGKDGGDLIINGKHTTSAVYSVWLNGNLDGDNIKTIRIPFEDTEHLSITDIKLIAINLNIEPEIRQTGFKRVDAIKFVVDTHFETNKLVTDKFFKECLTEWKFTPTQITSILKKAQNNIKKKNIQLNKNSNWIDYTKSQLLCFVNQLSNKNFICWYGSSGMFKWETLVNNIYDDSKVLYDENGNVSCRVFNKKKIKVYIHHTNPEHQEQWVDKYKEEILDRFELIFKPHGFTLKFEELPHLESNDVLV
jgi:hypothetical protein